jgi:hypothetical protein
MIDVLYHERNALQVDIEAHRSLISPARRLSVEVLQEKFLGCLPMLLNLGWRRVWKARHEVRVSSSKEGKRGRTQIEYLEA